MYYWFSTWFLLNIIVTVLNKVLFDHFEFSYLSLSEYHMITTAVLSYIVVRNSNELKFDRDFTIKMVILSGLFSLNVILGNASISYCSLAFAQLVRCTKPIITAILSYIILKKKESLEVWISLIPVVLGAVFVTAGEIKLTLLGFILTISGNIFSGLKGVMVKKYLSGDKSVPPMILLFYTSCYGSILTILGQITLDKQFPQSFIPNSSRAAIVISFQSICAFFLNYSNFEANKETNPILLNIGGNVKQVLMVLFSVYFFNSPMSYTGVIGTVITIIGAIWYGYVKDPANYNVLSPFTPR